MIEILGKFIGSMVIIIIIILVNVKDFVRLWKGRTDRYVQRYSGLMFTFVCLTYFVYEYNLAEFKLLVYLFYLIIYTITFFIIKKRRRNNYEQE